MAALCQIRLLEERDRLDAGNFKTLATTDILAGNHVVAADHIRFGFGELGTIAVVGTGRKRLLFAANKPSQFVFGRLTTVRAGEIGGTGLRFLVEEVTFFHYSVAPKLIVMQMQSPVEAVMVKKKGRKKTFRAATAVKQAARNVIGSPKPTKREVPKTKQEREKHKSTLRDLLSDET